MWVRSYQSASNNRGLDVEQYVDSRIHMFLIWSQPGALQLSVTNDVQLARLVGGMKFSADSYQQAPKGKRDMPRHDRYDTRFLKHEIGCRKTSRRTFLRWLGLLTTSTASSTQGF